MNIIEQLRTEAERHTGINADTGLAVILNAAADEIEYLRQTRRQVDEFQFSGYIKQTSGTKP